MSLLSAEEADLLTESFQKLRGDQRGTTSTRVIPTFFVPQQHTKLHRGPLIEQLAAVSGELHYITRTRSLIGNEELSALWRLLEQHTTTSSGPSMMNYLDFKRCGSVVATTFPLLSRFFEAWVFLVLPRDAAGCIDINALFDLVMKKASLEQVRLSLCLYDPCATGSLGEKDVEGYVLDQIANLPQLAKLDEDFVSVYAIHAARKFAFMLDMHRTGRICLEDLLCSDVLDEFLVLQQQNMKPQIEKSNWFSMTNATRVHADYLRLDLDLDGLLSAAELVRYDNGNFSAAFVERVFEVCQTYEGKIDYKVYLDIVVAEEFTKTPQALQFYFKILDIEQVGYLDSFALNYFWKSLQRHPRMAVMEPIPFPHIYAELFDMVKPFEKNKITLKDLIKSGVGDEVVGMLTSVRKLFAHENKESNLGVHEDDEAEVEAVEDEDF